MLASGVRSSCETIAISSVFSCSLSRSRSYCRSSSARLRVERLRHPVERPRQLADLAGPAVREPHAEVAAGEAARPWATSRTGRAIERAR